MTTPHEDRFPLRLQLTIYTIAFFAGNAYLMVTVIMPLWALELTPSPLLIGLIISARQVLVVTLSIHGGALSDRFGPRNVLMAVGLISAGLTMLFPAFPVIWVLIVLQLLAGIAESTIWIAAQALVGNFFRGDPTMTGRMMFALRLGGFAGPWMIGLTWQHLGSTAAFAFLAAWILCCTAASSCLPKALPERGQGAPGAGTGEAAADKAPARRAPDVMPKLSDYAATFRLLLISAVALVITVTFLRQAGSGVQNSFYAVWLKEHGVTAGNIGLLIAIANGASATTSLTVGVFTRLMADHILLVAATVVAVVAIAITPMLDGFALLALAIAVRGMGQGLNLPLMVTIASRAVGPHLQGRVLALRTTFNRFGGLLVPFAMGALAEAVGLEYAFYVIGIGGAAVLALFGAWTVRSPSFARSARAAPAARDGRL